MLGGQEHRVSLDHRWIPGSLKRAKAALKFTSCEKIATARVLFEPDGSRSIPVEVMPAWVPLFQKIISKQELGRQQKEQGVMTQSLARAV